MTDRTYQEESIQKICERFEIAVLKAVKEKDKDKLINMLSRLGAIGGNPLAPSLWKCKFLSATNDDKFYDEAKENLMNYINKIKEQDNKRREAHDE